MAVIELEVRDLISTEDTLPANAELYPWPDVRVGHSVLQWRQCLIVFGGFYGLYAGRHPTDNEEDPYHSTRRLWMFNAESKDWKVLDTYGESPPSLSSAGCAIVSDCLFVFCGFSRFDYYNDKVYRLDLITNIWTKVFPRDCFQNLTALLQPAPSGRDKLSTLEYKDNVYLFGGYGVLPVQQYELFQDIFVDRDREHMISELNVWHNSFIKFDCTSYEFSLVKTSGSVPSPRAACSTCKLRNCFYVFGGRLGSLRMSDMYCINLDTFVWEKIEPVDPSSPWPEGRSWGVMSPIGTNSKLLLHGGLNSQGMTLNDFWLFDTVSGNWQQLDGIGARLFWHSGCTIGDMVYMFGGFKHASTHTSSEESSRQMLIASLSPPTLQSLAISSISDAIVSSYGQFSQDSVWGILSQLLQPRDLAAIQRTVQQMKFVNCRSLYAEV